MILYYKITIKKLSEEGKNFKWGSCDCIKCNRKMWGHGYVTRYFSGIPDSVYLKRYRCPGCRSVVSINARMSCQSDLINFLDRCFEKELHFFT
jgi:hypothetical protein